MKGIFFVPDLQTVETIALEKGRDTEYAIQRYVLVFYANHGNPHSKWKLLSLKHPGCLESLTHVLVYYTLLVVIIICL